MLQKFLSRHRSTCCVQISWNLAGEIARCLPDKKRNFVWLFVCRYCADRAQNLPGPAPTMYSECSRFYPYRFTFDRVI